MIDGIVYTPFILTFFMRCLIKTIDLLVETMHFMSVESKVSINNLFLFIWNNLILAMPI